MQWAGWPDWANFCLLGDWLSWAVFLKFTEVSFFFHVKKQSSNFDKNGLGHILGVFFLTKSSDHTGDESLLKTIILSRKQCSKQDAVWPDRAKFDIWEKFIQNKFKRGLNLMPFSPILHCFLKYYSRWNILHRDPYSGKILVVFPNYFKSHWQDAIFMSCLCHVL
jgi:hypothetical protein